MRRMYGDERHISVLRAELESNDVEFFASPKIKDEFRRRYSKDMDGTKEFVKMFIHNSESRKFLDNSNGEQTGGGGKLEKNQKSIDGETSNNNVLYKTELKNLKTDNFKPEMGNKIFYKNPSSTTTTTATTTSTTTTSTTTTTTTVSPSTVADATYGTFTSDGLLLNNNTTETGNYTFLSQTEPTTQPVASRTETIQFNLTGTTIANETTNDDNDYDVETDEPFTTTTTAGNVDDVTTTETYFEVEEEAEEEEEVIEEEEVKIQKDKSENFKEIVEKIETIKQQQQTTTTTKKPVPLPSPPPPQQPQPQPQQQPSSPMIRLKGM